MFPGLFSICLMVFMPEADSLKHPPRFYANYLTYRKLYVWCL